MKETQSKRHVMRLVGLAGLVFRVTLVWWISFQLLEAGDERWE